MGSCTWFPVDAEYVERSAVVCWTSLTNTRTRPKMSQSNALCWYWVQWKPVKSGRLEMNIDCRKLCVYVYTVFPPPLRNSSYAKQYVYKVMAVMTRNVLKLMMQMVYCTNTGNMKPDYTWDISIRLWLLWCTLWAKFANVSRKDVQCGLSFPISNMFKAVFV
jgi:hypothetical protein